MRVIRAVTMFAFALMVGSMLLMTIVSQAQACVQQDQGMVLNVSQEVAVVAVENTPIYEAVTVVGFYDTSPAANFNPFNLIADINTNSNPFNLWTLNQNPFNILDNPFNVVAMTTESEPVNAANYAGMMIATLRSRNYQEGNLTQSLNLAYPVGMTGPTPLVNSMVL